jgi:esterase/lipase superfamily enzyme
MIGPRLSTVRRPGGDGARRIVASLAVAIGLAAAVAGCARPGPSVLIPTETVAPGAKLITVYVATTRAREPDSTIVYTNDRAPKLNYAEFTIAIPPHHKPGTIEWPTGTPDPQTDFVTVRQRLLTAPEFERKVAAGAPGGGNRKAGVFVHGYNVNFQEAVFRLAQMASDADIEGVPVLFAWPSDGKLVGYVADKDAATYSRDALARLLTVLTRDRKPGEVTLLGHSMGAWLTVEALRQLRLAGQNATLSRLTVVLASPDIDVDVFRAQMTVIGPLTPPMTILVSRDDKALAISGRIAGERMRLGALDVDDPRVQAGARAANVRVIDISSLKSQDDFNHDRFVTYATLYSRLDGKQRREMTGNAGPAGAFVLNTVGSVIASPFTLAGRALSGQ